MLCVKRNNESKKKVLSYAITCSCHEIAVLFCFQDEQVGAQPSFNLEIITELEREACARKPSPF